MSTLKVNSIIPVAGVPTGGGGGIIQIVQSLKKDTSTTSVTTNTTSSAFESVSNLTCTITPTSSSSKILVDFMLNCTVGQNGTLLMIFDDGSAICPMSDDEGNESGSLSVFKGTSKTEPVMDTIPVMRERL